MVACITNLERMLIVLNNFQVVAWSRGRSGRYARLRAANKTIELLNGLAPFEFRSRFRCDCSRKSDSSEAADTVQAIAVDCTI